MAITHLVALFAAGGMLMKTYTDVPGLARHLCVAESTVRAWVRHLSIPVIRVGRLIRFDVDAAEAWYETEAATGLAYAVKADERRRANDAAASRSAKRSAQTLVVAAPPSASRS